MRRISFAGLDAARRRELLHREWLLANGLGGYASGTLSGAVTWRYHGLLIAALSAPLGRTVMLNHLDQSLYFPDRSAVPFGEAEFSQPGDARRESRLVEFRLEDQLPVWEYDVAGLRIQKRVVMPYLQNTVQVTFTLKSEAAGLFLELQPSVHFRAFEHAVGEPLGEYAVTAFGRRFEILARKTDFPPLRMVVAAESSRFVHEGGARREIVYERDAERGYEARGALWTPGYFSTPLKRGVPVTLIASTEDWHTVDALEPDAAQATERERRRRLLRIADPRAQADFAAELVLAADNFVISPAGRVRDAARARAAGDELRSVIAGYHWFTDWGRDTMISLEGLTLVTGRHQEAAWVLRTFAQYVRDGLIPNLFPEGRNEGLYHTADASLWFFHAVDRYVRTTGDQETLNGLLPVLRDIIDHHRRGTKFGIAMDPADGLLREGAEGYQLTWMDAKVDDWVVTPRRGKPVEINALWYNALQLLAGWLRSAGDRDPAESIAADAARARASFNRRFWNPGTNCLFDVVDTLDATGGDDPSVRPNQLLAISLPHPVLESARWSAVLEVVARELLTPVGLRSLARGNPNYKAKYYGDLRSRDAAYHQGTVWAWLIGPFIDTWLKVHPNDLAGARRHLQGFRAHLDEACVGSISEIFDAEPPFTPRGCIAQAWSVAEVLRCLVLTGAVELTTNTAGHGETTRD